MNGEPPVQPEDLSDDLAYRLADFAHVISEPFGTRITPVLDQSDVEALKNDPVAFAYFRDYVEYYASEVRGGSAWALTVRRLHSSLLIGEPSADEMLLFVVCPLTTPEGMVVRMPQGHGYWQPYLLPLAGGQAQPTGFVTEETFMMRHLVLQARDALDAAVEPAAEQARDVLSAAKAWLDRHRDTLSVMRSTDDFDRMAAIQVLLDGPGEFTFDTLFKICHLGGIHPLTVLNSALGTPNEEIPRLGQ
jgi:hypothetical protein